MATEKHYQALLAGSLGVAGASLVALNLTTFQGQPLAPIGVLAGSAAVAAAIKRDQKYDLELEDYLAGVREGYEELAETVSGLLPVTKRAMKSQVVLKYLPEKYREPWLDFLEVSQNTDWIKDFTRKSKLVFGRTRSGKTFWFNYEARDFARRHPDGRLIICDLDFGSANEDGERNFWLPFGAPETKPRFIRDTLDGVVGAIKDCYEEMQRRLDWSRNNQSQAHKKWQRWKLLIDELPAVMTEAKTLGKKRTLSVAIDVDEDPTEMTYPAFLDLAIPQLLYRGLKQQIEVTFGAQGKAVSETGLNLQQQDQLNMLCLGSTATDRRVVGSIPGVEDPLPLIEKVRRLRAIPGGKYAAIVKIDDQITVKALPEISLDDFDIVINQATNPVEDWVKVVFSLELRQKLADLATQKTPLTKVVESVNMEVEKLGLAKVRQSNSDPLYVRLKEIWEEVKATTGGSQ